MMKCDQDKTKCDKDNDEEWVKKDEVEGEPGRGKGKWQASRICILKRAS